MNLKTLVKVGSSFVRSLYLKVLNGDNYQCHWLDSCAISTEIRIHKGGKLYVGKHLSTLRNVLISSCPGAVLKIGDNVNINTDCSIIAQKEIIIGDDVIFGPGVKIYDHDHDYHKFGKDRRTNFIRGRVKIGNGVWFGANCIVLRDTVIGDNCVFGAGCIIKGCYDSNSLIIPGKDNRIRKLNIGK